MSQIRRKAVYMKKIKWILRIGGDKKTGFAEVPDDMPFWEMQEAALEAMLEEVDLSWSFVNEREGDSE